MILYPTIPGPFKASSSPFTDFLQYRGNNVLHKDETETNSRFIE